MALGYCCNASLDKKEADHAPCAFFDNINTRFKRFKMGFFIAQSHARTFSEQLKFNSTSKFHKC